MFAAFSLATAKTNRGALSARPSMHPLGTIGESQLHFSSLRCCVNRSRIHANFLALAIDSLELNRAINQCKQSIIVTATDIVTGVEFGSALAHEDIPSFDHLSAVAFDSQAFGVGVATVSGTSRSFLMSHRFFWILDFGF